MPEHNVISNSIDATLFNKLSAHIALINQQGTVVIANKAWQKFDDNSSIIKRPQKGGDYLKMLQHAVEMGNDYALKLILGIKKVLENEKESFTLYYPLESTEGLHWFKLNFYPYDDDEQSLYLAIHEDVSTSIRSRQEQKEIKNRYQIQFEQSLDGILITDMHGHILDANPAAGKILGRDQNDLIARNRNEIMDVNDPEYQKRLTAQKEKGAYELEMNLIHKNGNRIPAEVASRAYRTRKGKLRSIVSFRDVSRRKTVEQDLYKSKQFTESALNSIPGIFFVLDQEGNLVQWNDNMETTLGYSVDELSQKNALDFVVPEEQSYVRESIQECIEVGELSVEAHVNTKEDKRRTYQILAKRLVREEQTYVIATGIDITNRKKAELENKKNQLMMEQLFENAPVGIAIVNTDDNIERVNKSFEKIFGYSREEAEKKNIDRLLAPEEKMEEAKNISQSAQNGISGQTETVRLHKNGKEVPVLIGSVPVEVEGEVIAFYGIYVDISQQYKYRQKIETTLQEKNTLLSELHHRVKNNLALINSLVELQVYESDNPQLTQELANTKNQIQTIASVHETLYQNGNLTNIPFNTFLKKLIETNAIRRKIATHNITVNIDTEDLVLNINQSIPCGLYLNELLSLICSVNDKSIQSKLNIWFREEGENVHLIAEGTNIIENVNDVQNKQTLHKVLIETLVNQLDGNLTWPTGEDTHQNFELIFTKKDKRGSASALLPEEEQSTITS